MGHQRPCEEGQCLFFFYFRRNDSDAAVAEQMLDSDLLEPLGSVRQLTTILDAGANLGVGAAVFATSYPNATIVCVEPSASTFEILRLNTARFPNVILVHAGLWPRVTRLGIAQEGRYNKSLSGAWTIQVFEIGQVPTGVRVLDTLEAVSVPFLLKKLDLPGFDLAKIDVEGSEREIFQMDEFNDLTWLNHSNIAIIEVHEDMRQGASKSVKKAFQARKRWRFLKRQGEEAYYVTDNLTSTMQGNISSNHSGIQ